MDEFDAAAADFWGGSTARKQAECIWDCEVKAHMCACAIAGLGTAPNLVPLDKERCFELLRLRLFKGPADTTNASRIAAEVLRQHLKCERASQFIHKVLNEIKRVKLGPGLKTSLAVVESGIAIGCSIKCYGDYAGWWDN
jgi:hypothetical protein